LKTAVGAKAAIADIGEDMMNKDKKTKKKLSLNRERIRSLTDKELTSAAGGVVKKGDTQDTVSVISSFMLTYTCSCSYC
jgi:hypothetical protein